MYIRIPLRSRGSCIHILLENCSGYETGTGRKYNTKKNSRGNRWDLSTRYLYQANCHDFVNTNRDCLTYANLPSTSAMLVDRGNNDCHSNR